MKFWPFPVMRNYSESKILTAVVLSILQKPDEIYLVKIDEFRTFIKGDFGEITFWSGNKMYAYCSEGSFVNRHEKNHIWQNEMPSRYACRKLLKFVEKHSIHELVA